MLILLMDDSIHPNARLRPHITFKCHYGKFCAMQPNGVEQNDHFDYY